MTVPTLTAKNLGDGLTWDNILKAINKQIVKNDAFLNEYGLTIEEIVKFVQVKVQSSRARQFADAIDKGISKPESRENWFDMYKLPDVLAENMYGQEVNVHFNPGAPSVFGTFLETSLFGKAPDNNPWPDLPFDESLNTLEHAGVELKAVGNTVGEHGKNILHVGGLTIKTPELIRDIAFQKQRAKLKIMEKMNTLLLVRTEFDHQSAKGKKYFMFTEADLYSRLIEKVVDAYLDEGIVTVTPTYSTDSNGNPYVQIAVAYNFYKSQSTYAKALWENLTNMYQFHESLFGRGVSNEERRNFFGLMQREVEDDNIRFQLRKK